MSTLYVDNLQPNLGNAVHAAGHVVQVQTTASALVSSVSGTTYTDILSLSFTPKFANSLLRIDCVFRYQENGHDPNAKYKILHDGTNVYGINYYSLYVDAATNIIDSKAFHCFANASDTDARIIKLMAAQATTSGGLLYINPNADNGTETRLTVMEIAQ